jgi:hypothetical protein
MLGKLDRGDEARVRGRGELEGVNMHARLVVGRGRATMFNVTTVRPRGRLRSGRVFSEYSCIYRLLEFARCVIVCVRV